MEAKHAMRDTRFNWAESEEEVEVITVPDLAPEEYWMEENKKLKSKEQALVTESAALGKENARLVRLLDKRDAEIAALKAEINGLKSSVISELAIIAMRKNHV